MRNRYKVDEKTINHLVGMRDGKTIAYAVKTPAGWQCLELTGRTPASHHVDTIGEVWCWLAPIPCDSIQAAASVEIDILSDEPLDQAAGLRHLTGSIA